MTGTEPEESSETDAPQPYCGIRIGQGLALIGDSTFVLVDPENGRFAEQLWSLVDAGAGVDELLEALSAAGLRSLGDFVMAQIEDDGVRIIVRGSGEAVVSTSSSTSGLEAGNVRTWVEEVFPSTDSFTLSIGSPTDEILPYRLQRGLVPADQLCWSTREPVSPALDGIDMGGIEGFDEVPVGDSRLGSGSEMPVGSVPGMGTSTNPEDSANDAGQKEGSNTGRPLDSPEGDDSYLEVSAAKDVESEEEPGDVSHHTQMPGSETEAKEVHAGADDEPVIDDYASLFGHTVQKSVQGAAVSVADAEEEPSPAPPETDNAAERSEATEAPPAETVAPLKADAPGKSLIQSVPAQDSANAASRPQLGDHDGHTVSKAQLQAMRAQVAGQTPEMVSTGKGPQVQAMLCSAGHPNPTQASSCRICSTALAGSPVMVSRPALGRLSFSSGETVELDRPVIIGRNPKVEGRMASEIPKLVKFDIGQALSRSHAMVRLEGWQVLLDDLGSANGTIVTLPGREPQRLHSGEPVLLETATTIDFGGEVMATYEAAL